MSYKNIPFSQCPAFRARPDLKNSAMLEQFYKDGMVTVDLGLPNDIMDDIVALTTATKGNRIYDAWQYRPSVQKLASNSKVMEILETLYQRRPIPFQTLNFKTGTEQCSHSDMIHFNSIPFYYMCGVWIALEDVTLENGPLVYYPGSHRLPFIDLVDLDLSPSELGHNKHGQSYEKLISGYIKLMQLEPKHAEVKRGQAVIWAANLIHGGSQILKKGSTRFSQVTHYFFEDCVYYIPWFTHLQTGNLCLKPIVNIATGKQEPHKHWGIEG